MLCKKERELFSVLFCQVFRFFFLSLSLSEKGFDILLIFCDSNTSRYPIFSPSELPSIHLFSR